MSKDSVNICDFEITTKSDENILDELVERLKRNEVIWVVTLNLEMIALSSKDLHYNDLIAHSNLYVADGMPIVWISRFLGNPIKGRTTGVDLTEKIIQRSSLSEIAIIGGVDPEQAIQIMQSRYSKQNEQLGYLFTGIVDLDNNDLIEQITRDIKNKNIKFVFIALGVPKQDKLARHLQVRLKSVVLIGVGGTFEMISGTSKRAPKPLQNLGLEWLWRLLHEPRRLWKRYLINYPHAVKRVLRFLFKRIQT
jgi:N-acetylglucosaminyldiphosphoundecaprenol N-acetyl-beta-D-mannosaminyltransferase